MWILEEEFCSSPLLFDQMWLQCVTARKLLPNCFLAFPPKRAPRQHGCCLCGQVGSKHRAIVFSLDRSPTVFSRFFSVLHLFGKKTCSSAFKNEKTGVPVFSGETKRNKQTEKKRCWWLAISQSVWDTNVMITHLHISFPWPKQDDSLQLLKGHAQL